MKVVKFKYNEKTFWGSIDPSKCIITYDPEQNYSFSDFTEVISYLNTLETSKTVEHQNLKDVTLLAPVAPSKNVLCIGKNYHDHILEFDGNADDIERVKETPIFFSKALSSVVGPFQNVLLHETACEMVDYEAELAIIIGKKGINISRDEANDYIFGYTVLNDVTSRDLQEKHQQWFKGKSLDTHCPIGPWLVTKDDLSNPQNLKIQSYINDELRQNGNTNLMMHDIKALIVQLSKGMTLNPGDIIATGTPKGVGKGFKPPKYLKSGDKMAIVIEGIGTLENMIM